ncbi:collagenase [Streptomyces sp. URMC 123]|uniref:collagenase n=1 Tax=Streptomyces sp. URMC 123 TaxID=3423403 RepID=UPI003F1D0074
MSHRRTPFRVSLVVALSLALGLPAAQSAQSATRDEPPPPPTAPARPGYSAVTAMTPLAADPGSPFDRVTRLATAPARGERAAPAPGGGLLTDGRPPGQIPRPDGPRPDGPPTTGPGAVPCALDAVTTLTPTALADFLTDPAVTADGCLSGLIWRWDARLAPVLSDAHAQAVADRVTALSPTHDGSGRSHLYELWTYLHAAVYHDFARPEIDLGDAPTLASFQRAITTYAGSPRTFEPTRDNGWTLREALFVAGSPGLRHRQLPLVRKVLATMAPGTPTATEPAWGGAALGALTVNYLGVHPGNQDAAFHAAVVADPGYRAAFRAFSGHVHLKGTANAWVVRDALGEYGRFGLIDALRATIVPDLGRLLGTARVNFGEFSPPWAILVSWLNHYDDCRRHNVCVDQIEQRLFPHTIRYDNGAITVRTALPRDTVDQLYYASQQVKAHFFRVLGTEAPLGGDTNARLTVHLYASRADYEVFHPLLTGLPTDNGGIYIERTATFYTYQRTPQDSTLTLEELFRHEYVHYLNGRWAVPGTFGEGPWYTDDRTTAMDEGTAEFLDGATRDDGVAVRKSLVRSVIRDTAGGGPRMTVDELLHATYEGDGFRFYSYAGLFFEFLWLERPSLIREMYGHLRADRPTAFDAWRQRLGSDTALQYAYDTFLDRQIARVDELFVPDTAYTPNDRLTLATAAQVRRAFAEATRYTPVCRDNGDRYVMPRFRCTGRITARLSDAAAPDRVFQDMSETVDHFLLDRAAPAATNLADMVCSFGPVDIWPSGESGTASYACEGPLRR